MTDLVLLSLLKTVMSASETASGFPCWNVRTLVVDGETTKALLVWHVTRHNFNKNHPGGREKMGPPEGKTGCMLYRYGPTKDYRPYYAQQLTDKAGKECVEIAPLRPSRSRDVGEGDVISWILTMFVHCNVEIKPPPTTYYIL